MTCREGEAEGQGNEETGCTSMRDKGLAWRNDSGLPEKRIIKEVARKQNLEFNLVIISLSELRVLGCVL